MGGRDKEQLARYQKIWMNLAVVAPTIKALALVNISWSPGWPGLLSCVLKWTQSALRRINDLAAELKVKETECLFVHAELEAKNADLEEAQEAMAKLLRENRSLERRLDIQKTASEKARNELKQANRELGTWQRASGMTERALALAERSMSRPR